MPSAKAKPASKPVSRWAAGCNARGKKRRNAVKLLNALADEVFLNTVPVKAPAARVEALVRVLDVHCQTGDLPGRLRAAVDLYLNNGGKFAAAVLPARRHAQGQPWHPNTRGAVSAQMLRRQEGSRGRPSRDFYGIVAPARLLSAVVC